MSELMVEEVSHSYGSTRALDRVSFTVGESELVALLGPSGCGKTTLLRMMAGFVPTTQGRILVGDTDISRRPPHRRNLGMVFQNYALFPHMTVAENVAFGLAMRRVPKQDQRTRIEEALRLVRLESLANRYPRQLSGGQQQRVAIARALVIHPEAFLLDEPLSNLDAQLRSSVGHEIRNLQKSLGLTTVFVTHDQTEAIALSDRLIILKDGRVIQAGTAAELYSHPVDTFVAGFLGQANMIPGTVVDGGLFEAQAGARIACDTRNRPRDADSMLCLRPEHILLGDATLPGRENLFEAVVIEATYYGATSDIVLDVPGVSSRISAQSQNTLLFSELPEVGRRLKVQFPMQGVFAVKNAS